MPTLYKNLTLRDKLAFLYLFKLDAANGPASAAFCLIELDIVVSESELKMIFRSLKWPDEHIEKLALLAPHHLML